VSRDKSRAGIVEHLKYALETFVGIVVGVGHGAILVKDEGDFGAVGFGLCLAEHVAQILGVHDEYLVKALKIKGLELARALLADVEAVAARDRDGARVGRLSCMPMAGACTVNAPFEAALGGMVAQDSFGEGASANVAEANHEDFHSAVGGCSDSVIGLKINCLCHGKAAGRWLWTASMFSQK
jgi:hypothetical protein